MDVITIARMLGKAIQEDSRYSLYEKTMVACDQCDELTTKMEAFKTLKKEATKELLSPKKDKKKIVEYNDKMKAMYDDIMSYQEMEDFNKARNEFNELLSFVKKIVQKSAEGEDPYYILPDDKDSLKDCSGDCSSCASTCS